MRNFVPTDLSQMGARGVRTRSEVYFEVCGNSRGKVVDLPNEVYAD
jgi:hypothetical protein